MLEYSFHVLKSPNFVTLFIFIHKVIFLSYMQNLNSSQIREIFLDFFTKNDHILINGASIIPKNDPTLLYINSGMAPMKRFFLGTEIPPYKKLSNVQPCIRTNDIEDVGDRHHLTFFEMMGSWSIGDYYKEKAITLAYDLLINHFKFPLEKLYATVYRGNPDLKIGPDTESIHCWEKAGFSADHIVPLGEDNFWGPAGDTGPCGPCTEVFFDSGDAYGLKYVPGGHFDDANRYIEIWNAGVFMELNKNKDGSFSQLPMKSVDTGSGIERMYLAINRCKSLYDVDTILPVYNKVKEILSSVDVTERELRVVTDHMRTTTMLLGEGVIPDKDGRGYIARRLIRKSIAIILRAGKSPFELKEVIVEVIRQMSVWYPELLRKQENILSILDQEVRDFDPVFRLGLELFNAKADSLATSILPGDFIFELVSTHGFPFEIISDLAAKRGLQIDEETYQAQYRAHQEVSRAGIKGKIRTIDNEGSVDNLSSGLLHLKKTNFTGYKHQAEESRVVKILLNNVSVNEVSEGAECKIIFDKTPFYAQAGGQVGDTGDGATKTAEIEITGAEKFKGIYLHSSIVKKGIIREGDVVQLAIDKDRRGNIEKNHSATHLLHAALQSVLGDHVVQKGSLVNEHKLRFDFSHNKPLTDLELKEVELRVNKWIWENYKGEIKQMNYQDAISSGAMALFNENYGDKVRVVNFGGVSVELCGGTHVKSTNAIEIFQITQECSAAKGIRRIEAVSGIIAYQQILNTRDLLKSVTSYLSCTSENLFNTVKKLKNSKFNLNTIPLQSTPSQIFTKEEIRELRDGIKLFNGQSEQDIITVQSKLEQMVLNKICDLAFAISLQEETIKVIVMSGNGVQGTYQADVLIKKWLMPFGGKGGGKSTLAKGGINDMNTANDVYQYVNQLV